MKNNIKLTDMWIAAALQSTGNPLTNIEIDDSGIATFSFESNITLESFSADYFNGKVKVDAQHYATCLRNIKGRIIYLTKHAKYKGQGSQGRVYGQRETGRGGLVGDYRERF